MSSILRRKDPRRLSPLSTALIAFVIGAITVIAYELTFPKDPRYGSGETAPRLMHDPNAACSDFDTSAKSCAMGYAEVFGATAGAASACNSGGQPELDEFFVMANHVIDETTVFWRGDRALAKEAMKAAVRRRAASQASDLASCQGVLVLYNYWRRWLGLPMVVGAG